VVNIMLAKKGTTTVVSLSQDNNSTAQERTHSEENWKAMLSSMKRTVERSQETNP